MGYARSCFTLFHFWRILQVGCSGPKENSTVIKLDADLHRRTKPNNQLWQAMRCGSKVLFTEERYRDIIVRRSTANPTESFLHPSNARTFRTLGTKPDIQP